MLTIKLQTPFGNEELYEATNVQFCPVEGANRNLPVGTAREPLGVLYIRGPGQALEQLSAGMVYVMNAAGSTVGKYDLGNWAIDGAVTSDRISAADMVDYPSEAQIKHMVSRFLGWQLPEDFRPDGGISFEPLLNKGSQYESKREPSGTNLFDATQATAMVRHMLTEWPGTAA